jgi:hypothetical protein
MRNFDRCSISSSFFESDHVSMNGSEFAFPASVPASMPCLRIARCSGLAMGMHLAQVGLIKIYRSWLKKASEAIRRACDKFE